MEHVTEISPQAYATRPSLSSSAMAEAGTGVLAPKLSLPELPPPPPAKGWLEGASLRNSDIEQRPRESPWSGVGAKPRALFPRVANASGVPSEDGLDTES